MIQSTTNEANLLDAFIAVREIVRRGIMALDAQPDLDERYRRMTCGFCFSVIHDAREAYGYNSPSLGRFKPSPHEVSQADVVHDWLAWLRREEGKGAMDRLWKWAKGEPIWRLAQQEGCSERTIKNRRDRSIAAIIRQFAKSPLEVEIVEEPFGGSFTRLDFTPLPGPHGEVVLRKVYVYEKGFCIGPKRWRDGRQKAERLAA